MQPNDTPTNPTTPERSPILTVVFSGFSALAITLLVLGLSRSWITSSLGVTRDTLVFLASLAVSFLVVAGYAFALQRGMAEEAEDLEAYRAESTLNLHQRFVSNVSHAIRNPLTGIVGFTQLLGDVDRSLGEESPVAGLVDPILGEVGELSRMIDDLLTSAKLDAGSVEPKAADVDAETFVGSLGEQSLFGGGRVEVRARSAVVAVDRDLLAHILRNLISNATRHGAGPMGVAGSIRGTRYVFTVSDRGDGIPESITAALVDGVPLPVGATGEALGLGLAVVRRIANVCDFDIGYRRVGGFTHVDVSVPLSVNDPSFRALRGNRSIRESLERLGKVAPLADRGLAAPRELAGTVTSE